MFPFDNDTFIQTFTHNTTSSFSPHSFSSSTACTFMDMLAQKEITDKHPIKWPPLSPQCDAEPLPEQLTEGSVSIQSNLKYDDSIDSMNSFWCLPADLQHDIMTLFDPNKEEKETCLASTNDNDWYNLQPNSFDNKSGRWLEGTGSFLADFTSNTMQLETQTAAEEVLKNESTDFKPSARDGKNQLLQEINKEVIELIVSNMLESFASLSISSAIPKLEVQSETGTSQDLSENNEIPVSTDNNAIDLDNFRLDILKFLTTPSSSLLGPSDVAAEVTKGSWQEEVGNVSKPAKQMNGCLSEEESDLVKLVADFKPLPQSIEFLSIGSLNHNIGTCKPCAFFRNPKKGGCNNGTNCLFCHCEHPPHRRLPRPSKRHRMIHRALRLVTDFEAHQQTGLLETDWNLCRPDTKFEDTAKRSGFLPGPRPAPTCVQPQLPADNDQCLFNENSLQPWRRSYPTSLSNLNSRLSVDYPQHIFPLDHVSTNSGFSNTSCQWTTQSQKQHHDTLRSLFSPPGTVSKKSQYEFDSFQSNEKVSINDLRSQNGEPNLDSPNPIISVARSFRESQIVANNNALVTS